jgi:hypothetical protein
LIFNPPTVTEGRDILSPICCPNNNVMALARTGKLLNALGIRWITTRNVLTFFLKSTKLQSRCSCPTPRPDLLAPTFCSYCEGFIIQTNFHNSSSTPSCYRCELQEPSSRSLHRCDGCLHTFHVKNPINPSPNRCFWNPLFLQPRSNNLWLCPQCLQLHSAALVRTRRLPKDTTAADDFRSTLMVPYPGLGADVTNHDLPSPPSTPPHTPDLPPPPPPPDIPMTEAPLVPEPTSTPPAAKKRKRFNPNPKKRRRDSVAAAAAPESPPPPHPPSPPPPPPPIDVSTDGQLWQAFLSLFRTNPVAIDYPSHHDHLITAFIESSFLDVNSISLDGSTKMTSFIKNRIVHALSTSLLQMETWAMEYFDRFTTLTSITRAQINWDSISIDATPDSDNPLEPIHIRALAITSGWNIIVVPSSATENNWASDEVTILSFSNCPHLSATSHDSSDLDPQLAAADIYSPRGFYTLWTSLSPDSKDSYIFLLVNSDLSFSGTRSDFHPSFNTLDLLNLSALK